MKNYIFGFLLLLTQLSLSVASSPEEGAVTEFRYMSFSQVMDPLKSIMDHKVLSVSPFGVQTHAFMAQQFQKTVLTNPYLDALVDMVATYQYNDCGRAEKLSSYEARTNRTLLYFREDPLYGEKTLARLRQMKASKPEEFERFRLEFLDHYYAVATRGHYVSRVTRFAKDPAATTAKIIARGAVAAKKDKEVFVLHPSLPITLLSSSKLPLTSTRSFLRRDDHHVYTFAGEIPNLLRSLKAVSPGTFWEPADERLITDASAPFVTAVEQNNEGSSLTPFIHLHHEENKKTIEIALGLRPFEPDLHQISVGLKDSQALPDPRIGALGQLQHSAIEVEPRKLGEVIATLRKAGLETIERPTTDSNYYVNVQKSLYMMFLPAILQQVNPDPSLNDVLGLLSLYGYYVKPVPVKEGEKQPLLAPLMQMRAQLKPEAKSDFDNLLNLIRKFIEIFHAFDEIIDESEINALASELAENLLGKETGLEEKTAEFESILQEILPRIKEAEKYGYFMEFVLKWDPDTRTMTGGLLSQTFTLPLAAEVTGRFTQWIELIERICFKEAKLQQGGDRGCSQFGGGSFSLSGTVNNFKQLIRGVTKAVKQTQGQPKLQLVTPAELARDSKSFVKKLIGSTRNGSQEGVLVLPEGQKLKEAEKRLLNFVMQLIELAHQRS